MDFHKLPAADLITALDSAGPAPDPDLIRACLHRAAEVRSGLLERVQQSAPGDQGYGEVHAAQLLSALRDPAALPYFEQVFRDERREELLDWYTLSVPTYGPLAVPFLTRVALDAKVHTDGRASAIEALATIGRSHPGERRRVLETVRSLLPRLDDHGALALPDECEGPEQELWTWAVSALGDLNDTESRAVVAKLDERGLLDSFVIGTGEELLAAFEPDAASEVPSQPFDVLADYESQFRADDDMAERIEKLRLARAFDERAPAVAPPKFSVPVPAPEALQTVRAPAKVGPNEKCPCGSGKKYKRCCGM